MFSFTEPVLNEVGIAGFRDIVNIMASMGFKGIKEYRYIVGFKDIVNIKVAADSLLSFIQFNIKISCLMLPFQYLSVGFISFRPVLSKLLDNQFE